METKFIKGTNEQYSIREDGAIISHYKNSIKGKIIYKDNILSQNKSYTSIYINNKKKKISINITLIKYFNFYYCKSCKTKVNCKSSIRNTKCKKCINELLLKNQKKWRLENPEKIKEHSIAHNLHNVKHVTKSYVACKLQIPVSLLSDKLYENYKATLLVKRKLSQKLNIKPAYL